MSGRLTERLQADQAGVARAAELLRGGGVVAFPTETVYGLGANALDPEAVARIFAAKQRPSWDPLIVHVSDLAMLERVAEVPITVGALIAEFWPGPLTLLLPKREGVPRAVTAGRPLVGVRMPRHTMALALITAAGLPIAAPSANLFGRTSPTTAAHVLEDLDGRIDAVLDGGAAEVGVESTVLDASGDPMVIYRPGAVTAEQISAVGGCRVEIFRASGAEGQVPESLPSPGVGLRHYAPRARLLLVGEGELETAAARLLEEHLRVGVMLPRGWRVDPRALAFDWGRWEDGAELAQRVFAGLRALDAAEAEVIVCPLPGGSGGGFGAALRDRLSKAAKEV